MCVVIQDVVDVTARGGRYESFKFHVFAVAYVVRRQRRHASSQAALPSLLKFQ